MEEQLNEIIELINQNIEKVNNVEYGSDDNFCPWAKIDIKRRASIALLLPDALAPINTVKGDNSKVASL